MNIRHSGIIVIAVLILIGIAILLPIYLQGRPHPTLMLSFNIVNNENIPNWCNKLFSTLQKYNIKATVFITGELAIADFSYTDQYNKYQDGQFIKYDLIAHNGSSSPSNDFLNSLSSSSIKKPVMVVFNNSIPINQIDSFIAKIKSEIGNIDFANASELTNIPLTVRSEA